MNESELLIAYGGEIKALGEGVIEGWLVKGTDDDDLDLEGDYFGMFEDQATDYHLPADEVKSNVYYAHGQDKNIRLKRLGLDQGTLKVSDKVNVWIRAQLDLRDEYERAIYGMAKAGKLGWSSGAPVHLVERVKTTNGFWIKSWPLGSDASITPVPAAGLKNTQVMTFKEWQVNSSLKALIPQVAGDVTGSATAAGDEPPNQVQQENTMSEEKAIGDVVAEAVASAMKAENEKREAEAVAAAEQAKREEEIKAAAVEDFKKTMKPTNDPGYHVPNVAKHSEVWKYDNYPAADLATALEVVSEAHEGKKNRDPQMVKALAMRLESSEADDESERTGPGGNAVKTAGPLKVASGYLKATGKKADETNYSTNASYGDEWIGVAYSGQLWEQVRLAAMVANKLPSFEFPAGAESMVIPLESSDPIWYLVAQAGDPTGATAQVTNTVPAKALGTANKTMTLGKLGSSTIYTGEMVEDSVLPFAAQLRTQIGISGGEVLDHVCIDGDTETGASTNINDIAGTPAGTEAFLVANGFRKSALVTTTANSRDGGALTTSDFIETVKLMGAAGKVAFDKRMTGFIIDPMTHWKALELADVKTKDIFANPTIESGQLVQVYGYEVMPSYFMHWNSLVNTSYEYLTEATGKIDLDTASDNTKGAILAVRWDYWRLGFRRRVTTEVERIPRADAWEITSLMRFGLSQRDTEASAISYNLTV